LIGYAFGMLQTSYIVGKISGIDIREHGSKNAGFTNTNRVLGIKKGAVVFIVDVLKAVAAFVVATLLAQSVGIYAGGTFFYSTNVLPGLYAGFGAILGHCFPFYLKFKGGKGVACTLGVIIMLDWRVMAISFAVGLIIVLITRYISLASLSITLLVPVLMLAFAYGYEAVGLTAAMGALIWFLHRGNIEKLLSGAENKFSFRRQKSL
jgi:glycerol-3-phosphate acyltransferase PlsY